MVRYVLWTVYICVSGHKNSLEESCYHCHIISVTETNRIAYRHQIRKMPEQ